MNDTGRRFAVLVTDTLGEAGLRLLRSAPDVDLAYAPGISGENLLRAVESADAIVTRSGTPVDAGLLEAAKRLRIVARAGVGVDNVDLDAATMRGVLVLNTPTANIISATEHTMAMLLALLRSIPAADASIRRGEWNRGGFLGRELDGKTVGIIGFGRIGSRVGARCRAFGARILACDPYIAPSVAERGGADPVDLDTLLRSSDVVTVHTPLTDETRGMISASEIERMKDGAIVLNVARGGIFVEKDLADALRSGKIAAAAVDVFEREPPGPDHPLVGAPNTVLTPHLGANTTEAQDRVAIDTARMIVEALRGSLLVSAVNLPFAGEIDSQGAALARLAEKIGRFTGQVSDRPCEEVNVALHGVDAGHARLVTVAALRGLLHPHLRETVNFVNAEAVASGRGIRWSSTVHPESEDYHNLVTVTGRAAGKTTAVSGTLFHTNVPRIVDVDGYRVEFEPSGWVLHILNRDVPGVVGKVGTFLGDRGVNIAEYDLARTGRDGLAMAVVTIDEPVDRETLKTLRSLDEIVQARLVEF